MVIGEILKLHATLAPKKRPTMSAAKPKLRSQQWFGTADKNGFMYRSWMKNQGIPDHEFDGRLIIGICNTWSELTPCNAHFRKLAEHVKRGIYEAGMAEVGNMGLPPKLLRQGVKDMVRISDARMSGTAYGTVVLHVAPEAAASRIVAAPLVICTVSCAPYVPDPASRIAYRRWLHMRIAKARSLDMFVSRRAQ